MSANPGRLERLDLARVLLAGLQRWPWIVVMVLVLAPALALFFRGFGLLFAVVGGLTAQALSCSGVWSKDRPRLLVAAGILILYLLPVIAYLLPVSGSLLVLLPPMISLSVAFVALLAPAPRRWPLLSLIVFLVATTLAGTVVTAPDRLVVGSHAVGVRWPTMQELIFDGTLGLALLSLARFGARTPRGCATLVGTVCLGWVLVRGSFLQRGAWDLQSWGWVAVCAVVSYLLETTGQIATVARVDDAGAPYAPVERAFERIAACVQLRPWRTCRAMAARSCVALWASMWCAYQFAIDVPVQRVGGQDAPSIFDYLFGMSAVTATLTLWITLGTFSMLLIRRRPGSVEAVVFLLAPWAALLVAGSAPFAAVLPAARIVVTAAMLVAGTMVLAAVWQFAFRRGPMGPRTWTVVVIGTFVALAVVSLVQDRLMGNGYEADSHPWDRTRLLASGPGSPPTRAAWLAGYFGLLILAPAFVQQLGRSENLRRDTLSVLTPTAVLALVCRSRLEFLSHAIGVAATCAVLIAIARIARRVTVVPLDHPIYADFGGPAGGRSSDADAACGAVSAPAGAVED